MHLTDEAQRQFKRERLQRAFEEYEFPTQVIGACRTPSAALGSRNKVSFVVARKQGQIVLGAFRRGTHAVQPMMECALPEAALNRAVHALHLCLNRAGCPIAHPGLRVVSDGACGRPNDDWSGRPAARREDQLVTDGLRYVVMRSNRAGQVAALLLTPSGELPLANLLAKDLQQECPEVVAVYLGQSGEGNAMVGAATPHPVVETAPLEDELGGLRYRVSPSAFFQVNRDAADALHEQVREAAAGERILDVYCGAGAITLRLAKEDRAVIGIERNPQAILAAEQGARDNGLSTLVSFEVADAMQYLQRAADEGVAFDTVVFNPPRKGCGSGVIEALPKLAPECVVYVSCNPKTLARDSARLRELGYALQEVTPYDLFPHSEHVEAVAVFTRPSAS